MLSVQRVAFSANENLSVNKLFQCKLGNVRHLRISGHEFHINNHGPRCACVYLFVGVLQISIYTCVLAGGCACWRNTE